MDDNHTKFLKFLDESQLAVFKVAQWLGNQGYTVAIPPTTKAERREDWAQHSDKGDLFLVEKDGEELDVRIEVKHRGIPFTTKEDFKFDDVIVCTTHSFDRAEKQPDSYIHLSADMGHAMIIKTKYHDWWTTRMIKDSRYNNVEQECYICSKDNIQFIKFDTNNVQ
jgi:hypothetical protein